MACRTAASNYLLERSTLDRFPRLELLVTALVRNAATQHEVEANNELSSNDEPIR